MLRLLSRCFAERLNGPMARINRRSTRLAIVAAIVAALMTVAMWPTSRFVGVNFVVSEQQVPLWTKAVDFVHRDVNIAATARSVIANASDEDGKAAAALAWTQANVRPQPLSLPVLDDHIWHIMVRGYGQPDQQADVFTTLLAYGNVRAYWMLVGEPPDEVPISYVWIRGRWRVYDVANRIVFRNREGDLATPDDLAADHQLIHNAASFAGVDPARYVARFDGYSPPQAPDVLRADLQMPQRRLWHELRSVVGLQGREWSMREPAMSRRAEEEGQR